MESSDESSAIEMDNMATESDNVIEIIAGANEPIAESSTAFVVKRGRQNFMTPRLVSALDNAKVSDGMAVHILIAAAEALGHRVNELAINRSTIHRLRQANRKKEAKNIQADFSDSVI